MPQFELAQKIYCLLVSEFPMMGPVHVRHGSVKYIIQIPFGMEHILVKEKIKNILSVYKIRIDYLFCTFEVTVWPNE